MHMHNTVYYQKQEEKNAVYCGTFAKKYLEADWDVAAVAKPFAVEIKNIIWKLHCVSKKTRHQTLAHNFPKC